MRLRKPTPSFAVAVTALVVSLGGTSYAVAQFGSEDIRDQSLRSIDIENGTITRNDVADETLTGNDILDSSIRASDLSPNAINAAKDGSGRWALINAAGEIEAQSGGFSVTAAYVTLPNTAVEPAPSNAMRAAGNVYIDAGEDLSDNGIVVSIALQNQLDQNGDGVMGGRAPGPDANPEFAGEISTSQCAIATVVACAPPGTNNANHFVVSPRNSDGTVTNDGTHKRFYVVITGK